MSKSKGTITTFSGTRGTYRTLLSGRLDIFTEQAENRRDDLVEDIKACGLSRDEFCVSPIEVGGFQSGSFIEIVFRIDRDNVTPEDAWQIFQKLEKKGYRLK